MSFKLYIIGPIIIALIVGMLIGVALSPGGGERSTKDCEGTCGDGAKFHWTCFSNHQCNLDCVTKTASCGL